MARFSLFSWMIILQRYGHFIKTSNQQDGLFSCGGGLLGYDFLGFLLSLPLENANCDKVKGFNNFIFRYLKLQRRARFGGTHRVVLYIGNSPPITKKILKYRNPQYLWIRLKEYKGKYLMNPICSCLCLACPLHASGGSSKHTLHHLISDRQKRLWSPLLKLTKNEQNIFTITEIISPLKL